MADVGLLRSERSARTEKDDVVLVNLLDRGEEEKLVAGDRTAEGEAEKPTRALG